MEIDNITEGLVVKNYKELCKLLEIKTTTGGAKQIQLRDMERYFHFYKEGNKFIITKVFDKPKPKPISENSKYIKEIEYILVTHLNKDCKDNGYHKVVSFCELIKLLGMVNDNYSIGSRHRRELGQVLNVSLMGVHYFYDNTANEFKRLIERALNNLQKRRILNWKTSIKICKKIPKDEIERLGTDVKHIYTIATPEEEQEIINYENLALRELGVKTRRDVFLKKLRSKYQKEIKNLMPDTWKYYFYCYDLTIGDIAIELEDRDLKAERINLNEKIKERSKKKLKIINEDDEELVLVDNLIDILKNDSGLDRDIAEQSLLNQKELYENIKNKQRNIELLKLESNLLSKELTDIFTGNTKDEMEMSEYIEYSKSRKDLYAYENDKEDNSNIESVIKELSEFFGV